MKGRTDIQRRTEKDRERKEGERKWPLSILNSDISSPALHYTLPSYQVGRRLRVCLCPYLLIAVSFDLKACGFTRQHVQLSRDTDTGIL